MPEPKDMFVTLPVPLVRAFEVIPRPV